MFFSLPFEYNEYKEGEDMKKAMKIFLISLSVFIIGLGSMGYIEYQLAIQEVSIDEKISEIMREPDFVHYDDISPILLEATVAVEDKRFYDHHGIDVMAYARIFYYLIKDGNINSGGSTITQQLAKNLYFSFEPSLTRKVAELFVANRIEKTYDKETILSVYLNIINYGDNQFGIAKASEHYFEKKPSELSFDEATLLAGIPQSPTNYQLSNHLDSARLRQKAVLANLEENNVYSKEVFAQFLTEIPQ